MEGRRRWDDSSRKGLDLQDELDDLDGWRKIMLTESAGDEEDGSCTSTISYSNNLT